MKTKFLEIRDSATCIPALAFTTDPLQESEAGAWLLRHSGFGYGSPCVFLVKLATGGAEYDPYRWGGGARTMTVAHQYIEKHFDELKDGDVVDVEFILGLSTSPKISERLEV